jgi:predicted N-acetyltransferase YhbS
MWDVRVGGRPAIFLGPLAVDASRRGSGTGGALVERACEAAAAAGAGAVLLVGDPPLFERFGFSVEAARDIVLPGAVDQKRVMLRALKPDVGDMGGLVT